MKVLHERHSFGIIASGLASLAHKKRIAPQSQAGAFSRIAPPRLALAGLTALPSRVVFYSCSGNVSGTWSGCYLALRRVRRVKLLRVACIARQAPFDGRIGPL